MPTPENRKLQTLTGHPNKNINEIAIETEPVTEISRAFVQSSAIYSYNRYNGTEGTRINEKSPRVIF